MIGGVSEEDRLEPLSLEALGWIVRLTSGSTTRGELKAFRRWRAQSPAHEAAFREAAAFRRTLRIMDRPESDGARVVAFPSRRAQLDRRALITAGSGALAAGVGGWMIFRPPLGLWPSYAELMADHRTGVGERKNFTPVAGVTVELNGRTALSVQDRGERVSLIDGEAYVATDGGQPSAFRIDTGGQTVLLRAGSLNVTRSPIRTCITCITGGAQVQQAGVSIALSAGQQFVAPSNRRARVQQVNVHVTDSWRRGVLMFNDTPLAIAVEDVNRYWKGRIIVRDSVLAERPVNGMFHTDQIGDAVVQFQQFLHAPATHLPGGVVLLG